MNSDLCTTGTTQAGDGSPNLQRALVSIISTPTRVDGAPDRSTTTATDTRSHPRRLPSRSEAEPCPKTTFASRATTAGRRRSLWRPARPCASWRKELAASGQEKLPTLPYQTGRRRRLPRDRRPRSGSSSIAGERRTMPSSPPPLLLLLTASTTRLTPPRTLLRLKRPDRGPTVFLRRGRKCRRAARAATAAKLRPRNTSTPPPPIRISLRFRSCHLPSLRPVLCSPGGPSDRWLCPRERGTRGACTVDSRRGWRCYHLYLHLHHRRQRTGEPQRRL